MKQYLSCWYDINSFIEAFISFFSSLGICILRHVLCALLHPFTEKQDNTLPGNVYYAFHPKGEISHIGNLN